jgi:hypothetical protein
MSVVESHVATWRGEGLADEQIVVLVRRHLMLLEMLNAGFEIAKDGIVRARSDDDKQAEIAAARRLLADLGG